MVQIHTVSRVYVRDNAHLPFIGQRLHGYREREANVHDSLLTEADSRSPGRPVWMSAPLRGTSRGHEGEIANIYCATERIGPFAR